MFLCFCRDLKNCQKDQNGVHMVLYKYQTSCRCKVPHHVMSATNSISTSMVSDDLKFPHL